MRRDQLPEHQRPTYVLPRYKTVYVAVSKSACTSLKWLVADVQGEDSSQFTGMATRMITRDMAVHLRSGFKQTPTLHELDSSALADISPENGWFVFTVVRHPSARLFSAWQSKLLLREPKYAHRYGARDWFPRAPHSGEEVVEDFRRFVAALPGDRILEDRHFMVQWREMAGDRMPYSRVYDTSEVPALLDDLGAHLRAQGWQGELALRESNGTPLRPIRALFDDAVCAVLRDVYADDFDHLGYSEVLPPKLADAWGSVAEVQRLIERHERIGDLAGIVERLKGELAEARGSAPPAPGPLARLRAARPGRKSPR
jgi:hypothetical protein